MAYIELENVVKSYRMGEQVIHAVDGLSCTAEKGELCAIVGPSGAGKTTVLNIIGGMDTADSGRILIDGASIDRYRNWELTAYRRHDIGFVFQFYNLVPNLTALENVELASYICRSPLSAAGALERVGLAHRMNNFPAQLSGGEQQRVAIARALAKNPKLLLCDEPTGALDSRTGRSVLSLLYDSCRLHGMTVLLITHNLAITPMADRVIQLKNGKVVSERLNARPVSAAEIEW